MKCIQIAIIWFISACSAFAFDDGRRIKSITTNYSETAPFLMPISSEIEFFSGVKVETEVVEFEFIDLIESNSGSIFILFAGRTCTECDMAKTIYISSIKNKKLNTDRAYPYPGKQLSHEDGSLMMESRLFYGECLVSNEPSLVWHAGYYDDNKWQKIINGLNVRGTELLEIADSEVQPVLLEIESRIKKHLCIEVAGQELYSSP